MTPVVEALRPGDYVITFTLTGFNTSKREGIELSANFTATVNAEMKVGSLEETVTVSGASPVVDVKSATQGVSLGVGVRVIAGELGGRRLKAPRGLATPA